MYKQVKNIDGSISTTVIQRLSDKAFIPCDEGNTAYQQYLEWEQAGNTPQPSDIVTINYPQKVINIDFLPNNHPLNSKILNIRYFCSDTIEQAIYLKMTAVREDRNTLLTHSDLVVKNAYSDGNDGLRIGIKNNRWVKQLRELPAIAEQELQAIANNGGTIQDIFEYVPDFSPAPLAAADVILTLRQFILALTLSDPAFITNEEAIAFASDKTVPASIQAVFDGLPVEYRVPAVLTFKTMQNVPRNDPLVAAAGQSWGLTTEQLDQFFLTAFEL